MRMVKMNKNRIIAFAGRKRSGKGMLALGVKEYYPNTEIIAVADNLKQLCCKLLNIDYNKLNKMKDDGTIFCQICDDVWVDIIHKETNIDKDIIKAEIGGRTFSSVRQMLQIIGTNLIRKYYPDWHIDKTIERIKTILQEDKNVVVDDVRFPNEKKKIEELGGLVYFVIRPNWWDISNHPSETALKYSDFDNKRVIINDLDKETMVGEFKLLVDVPFYDKCQIQLSANPWYLEHKIDISCDKCAEDVIKSVYELNKNNELFQQKGIITLNTNVKEFRDKFQKIFLNNIYDGKDFKSYSIYNPLTNEIIKEYIKTNEYKEENTSQ